MTLVTNGLLSSNLMQSHWYDGLPAPLMEAGTGISRLEDMTPTLLGALAFWDGFNRHMMSGMSGTKKVYTSVGIHADDNWQMTLDQNCLDRWHPWSGT